MRTITTGIYKIIQKSTGKFYIGSSINIEGRWKKHRYDLRTGRHTNSYLLNVWNKYGSDDFTIEIVETCAATKKVLLEREQHYIDTLHPEFNLCPKAGSRLGSKASQETKAKMSASMRGKNVGKVRSGETRAKLSEIARSISPETREKMAAAKRGTTVSQEIRDRMSQAHTGRPKDPTSIQKTIAARNERRLEKLSKIEIKTDLIKNDVRHQIRTLTDDQVRTIRSSTETDLSLSKAYSCSPGTISKIRRRITYKDVL